ncbi:hypothetical protein PMAYCL1PPCAC_15754, partial [Pristionchus mayeri]
SFDWSPSSLPLSERRYPYTALQRSSSFAASFAGGLIGTVPMLYVLRRLGAHMTMFAVGAISSLLCALTPQTIALSFELLVALRFVTGFVTIILFPVIGLIIEEWAGVQETGFFVAVLTAYLEIAPLFTLPVGSLIAEKVNWPTVFYVHGLACALFTILWLMFYR